MSICEIYTRQQTVTIWNPLFLLKYRSRWAKTNELSWTKFSCQTLLNKYMLFIKFRREYLTDINEMVKVSNTLSLQCFFLNNLKNFTWNKLFMGTWFYWKKTGNSTCDTVWIAYLWKTSCHKIRISGQIEKIVTHIWSILHYTISG